MTIAWGYRVEIYRVFLLSLRRTDYTGDIKIIAPANSTRPEAKQLCDELGAHIIDLEQFGYRMSDGWLMGARFVRVATVAHASCGPARA